MRWIFLSRNFFSPPSRAEIIRQLIIDDTPQFFFYFQCRFFLFAFRWLSSRFINDLLLHFVSRVDEIFWLRSSLRVRTINNNINFAFNVLLFLFKENFIYHNREKLFSFFLSYLMRRKNFLGENQNAKNHISNWTLAVWLSDLNCSIADLRVNKFKLSST